MKHARFTKPLTLAFEPETYDQIKKISDEQRISMAEWVREMAAKALVKNDADNADTLLKI
jgi:hypothetical protein